jgi:hypothetical protein
MLDTGDLLFALDGVIGQCAIAKLAAEGLGQSSLPIESVYASLMVLRMLIESDAQATPAESGPCKHPADRVKRTVVGGGNYYLMCQACNEIVEQS